MEWWDVAVRVVDVTGWGAFVALAGFNVTAFIRGWIYPASVTAKFEKAWEIEQKNRRDLEAGKYELLLTQGQSVLKQLEELGKHPGNLDENDRR